MGLSVSLYDECMITSIRLVNFKNFADETLRLGPFTVIVGANASGKSNIRDAFRFLHGIGRGYTLAEIIGGKVGPGGQMEWQPLRGAPNEIGRLDTEFNIPTSTFSMQVELDGLSSERIYYSIDVYSDAFGPDGYCISREELTTASMTVYRSDEFDGERLRFWREGDIAPMIALSKFQPALSQFFERYRGIYEEHVADPGVLRTLKTMHFLEPSLERMREPPIPGAIFLGNSGQNLATALENICSESKTKDALLSWVGELTPMDVKDFEFPRDPSGRVHLQIVERNGRKVSAYSTSDGTLRFLAILTALLSPDRKGIYFFEEIDTGIHPARLWLLLDFIERETAKGDIQVVTTTQSPALLTWMNDATFEHTSVVYRDDYWSDSIIRPIAGLYNLRELRKSTALGELFTSNWIGEALKFSEGEPDTDHLDEADEDGEHQQ